MIKNLTRKTIIAKSSRLCKDVFSQGLGLMFRFKPPKYALVFVFKHERLVPITMFFMFFSIDIVFLDKNLVVVEKKLHARPFTNYFPNEKSQYVVELSTGAAKDIKIGDKLSIAGL